MLVEPYPVSKKRKFDVIRYFKTVNVAIIFTVADKIRTTKSDGLMFSRVFMALLTLWNISLPLLNF